MAGTYIGTYDTTAGSNSATASNTVSVAEGMLPSNINNALRDIMADVRQWYNTAEWIEYGDGAGTYTATYASGTSFTIDGINVTTPYHAGRRVKLVASTPGTIYGTISSSTFSTNTTVNMSWDSGSLSNEAITSVHIGITSAINTSTPESLAITGDYTLDVSGDIILDADGADILLKDGGTQFGELTNSSSDFVIKSSVSDKDVLIKGNDGGSGITALTLDMSAAGKATFNNDVIVSGLTASTALTANGSKQITSSAVTDTELGYLDGASSNIQTQITGITAGTLTTIDDDNFTLQDNADTSKKAQFQCSGISSSTTRTFTLPDANGTLSTLASVVADTTPQLGGQLDVNGQALGDGTLELLKFTETGSAVNEFTIANAAAGAGPTLSSTGTETNVDINITPKGTGDVVLVADTVTVGDAAAAATLRSNGAGTLTVTTGGTTDLILSTNNGTASGTVTITDAANGAITLAPNGTGIVDIQSSMNPSLSSTGKSMVMGF